MMARQALKLVTREYGQDVGYVKDYPFNYFLSGDQKPVQFAEALIRESSIPIVSPTAEIEAAIRKWILWGYSGRSGRNTGTLSPA
jgi:hypothetical protein